MPKLPSRAHLQHLLTISQPQKESIYSVIGRMEVLIDYFQSHSHFKSLLPFLKTYYLVTKRGADKYIENKHFFWSIEGYQQLDVYFASLYFQPLLHFLETGEGVHPWQQYFKYIKTEDSLPFLQIILGINAHINADLYKALIDLDYRNKNDFFLVNKLLQEIEPEVIKILAKEHDLIGLSGLAFSNFINDEFKSIIVRWRKEAWENAQATNHSHKIVFCEKICQRTENLAKLLIQDFTHIYHLQHLPTNILQVNNLTVRLQ